ncbi:MAG TPA: DUF2723 domain-containing protein [Bacteroidetes bacterium]|nr:DUF2723 domain-containing protein [Bacteroidota bacterium]
MSNKRIDSFFPYLMGLFAFAVYELSNAKGFFWGDSGEFIAAAGTLGIGHAYGHPLFWLFGRVSILLEPGNPAAAMNHLVALFSAATVVVVVLLAQNWCDENLPLPHRITILFTVAGIYALGSTIWSQASYTEVYNFQAFFLALAIYFLDRYFFRGGRVNHLYFAGYMLGLAATLGMYVLSLGILPVFLWVFIKQRPRLSVAAVLFSAVFFLIGLSVWLYLPLRAASNPPLLIEKIDSLKALLIYLRRSHYFTGDVAGWVVLPMSLLKSFRVVAQNLGMWGILLTVFAVWALFDRKKSRGVVAYLAAAVFLTLFFAILLPLNLNISQMVEMDVYLTPVFLLTVPVLTVGAVKLAASLKKSLRFLLLLPVLIILVARWEEIDLANKQAADSFVSYLNRYLPDSSSVMPFSDEVSYPVYYSMFALGNPKNFSLFHKNPLDSTGTRLVKLPGERKLFVYSHGSLLKNVRSFAHLAIAGPFITDRTDSVTGRQLEENFVRLFSYDNLKEKPLNEKDKVFLARIWNSRGLFWYGVTDAAAPENPLKQRAYRKAIMAFYQAYLFDDFSYNGALYAGNIAIMLNNAGKSADAVDFANQALQINPYSAEAFDALYHIALNKQDFRHALAHLQQQIKIVPHNSELRMELAALYLELAQPDKAKDAYQKGLALGGSRRASLDSVLIH